MKPFLPLFLSAFILMACSTPSADEGDYVDFLYANMSLPDSIDYDRDFYTEQVHLALQARAELPWGRQVPEREFLHFVLPPRVSNEDLDHFRSNYYEELRDRVQHLSMSEAVLEVNHWCHEHVTYRPTSARTLGPESTIRTAYGRCGEESVLLVAALRTVGIPARQVYTPRWAHTDDNHAWVEAWADGRWWFLGACEPEPILNLGWFNESASRGMLMHTKVFGVYDGPEEVVNRQRALTEINVTDIYAPTRRFTVTVLDSLENPVEDAVVEFKLYNYAEFYTVARKLTDAKGQASLTAGLGDILVWASTPAAVAWQKVSFASDSVATLHLSSSAIASLLEDASACVLDVTPPPVSTNLPTVSAGQRAENNRRLAIEDSIRHAYEATMPDQRSRGNHAVIQAFRDSAAAMGLSGLAEQLIVALPDKDLQDITPDVLWDNVTAFKTNETGSQEYTLSDVQRSYLLSPRIERERLTSFKAPLAEAFRGFTVQQLIAWTRDSLLLVEDRNPQHLRMQPLGVYRSRMADRLGRDIFFVAACRALSIPARINEINGKVQYFGPAAIPSPASSYIWNDVTFDGQETAVAASSLKGTILPSTGTLHLTYKPASHLPDAKYYTHFTISRLDERNQLQLLTYPEEATFQNTFAQGVTLDAGTYLLTTGIRMADGGVRAHLQFFTIQPSQTSTVPLVLRAATDAVSVIGSLNAEDLYQPLSVSATSLATDASPISLLSTTGRGYYVLGIIAPNQEPTNHALRDIALVSQGFEAWGRKLVLLFEDADAASRFNFPEFRELPSTTVWGTDVDGAIKREVMEQMHLSNGSLPIFLICDSFNRVVFIQQGYTIGLGEQLLKVIHQL